MRILALEPYDTGSHGDWLKGLVAASSHQIVPLTLKGQFWKWRMHGGAVTLARRFLREGARPDLILASDMLDLTTFLALTRSVTHSTPVALYMHENQLTYPMRPGEKRDLHYGFINYASMLCADRVLFNSAYHLEAWFDELPRLLKHFPDHSELDTVALLRERSEVLPVGLSLAGLDDGQVARRGPDLPLLIVWNHRWEYDKNPEDFLHALYALAERGCAFEVAVLGESFVAAPPIFEEARARLGARIVQFGYAPSRDAYARWLWEADVVVSTAIHEFFGVAVVEALYCDCYPLLPDRLTYPGLLPPQDHATCIYPDQEDLVERLAWATEHTDVVRGRSWRPVAARYDWSRMAPEYDRLFTALAATAGEHSSL